MGREKIQIPIGVLFSTTGSYATLGRDLVDGALLAIEAINADPAFEFAFVALIRDPAGTLDGYHAHCDHLLRHCGVRHIIGCYTSSSRKEIIPIVEKFDALLWYPSHYEGFESCDHVIYCGAAPNQHLVPLAAWALPRYGRHIYCLGSNYIWPWENNRIMREIAQANGGAVLRERYLPIGATDVDAVIADIRNVAPDLVFNTLIGESCYAFYRAYHRLAAEDPRFRATRRPILSCSLSEPELRAIGDDAARDHIASSVYFQSIASAENAAFIAAFRARFGHHRATSADAEAAYLTTLLLARALQNAGRDDIAAVKAAAYGLDLAAPQGKVWVEPENNHCWLTPRIGRAVANAQFAIEWEAPAPLRPDPYLAGLARHPVISAPARGARHLRLVGH